MERIACVCSGNPSGHFIVRHGGRTVCLHATSRMGRRDRCRNFSGAWSWHCRGCIPPPRRRRNPTGRSRGPGEKSADRVRTGDAMIQVADRERFELSIPLRVCRISSAVHSTALPPVRKAADHKHRSAPLQDMLHALPASHWTRAFAPGPRRSSGSSSAWAVSISSEKP